MSDTPGIISNDSTCSLKLLFSIYILFNFNIAQASNKIHVHYNYQIITFKQNILEEIGVINVADLLEQVKFKLRNEKISDKVITLYHR